MPKPVLFTVDDDPQVLAAIARDLRERYARDYRVLRAERIVELHQGQLSLDSRPGRTAFTVRLPIAPHA